MGMYRFGPAEIPGEMKNATVLSILIKTMKAKGIVETDEEKILRLVQNKSRLQWRRLNKQI